MARSLVQSGRQVEDASIRLDSMSRERIEVGGKQHHSHHSHRLRRGMIVTKRSVLEFGFVFAQRWCSAQDLLRQ